MAQAALGLAEPFGPEISSLYTPPECDLLAKLFAEAHPDRADARQQAGPRCLLQ